MQRKGEAASLIEFAGYAHFLTEVLHDFVSDGKPQARDKPDAGHDEHGK